jgi:transposase
MVCGMARKWTKDEEKEYRTELRQLYVAQNKSIGEISAILGIAEQTVFQRLNRLGIKTSPHLKKNYLKSAPIYGCQESIQATLRSFWYNAGRWTHFSFSDNRYSW